MSEINSKYHVYVKRVVLLDRAYSYASFSKTKINGMYVLAVFEGEFIESKL